MNEHKPKMNAVMAELLQYFAGSKRCAYCDSNDSYNEYRVDIGGYSYTFCSEWCILTGEMEMRRNWMRAIQQANATKKIEELKCSI